MNRTFPYVGCVSPAGAARDCASCRRLCGFAIDEDRGN